MNNVKDIFNSLRNEYMIIGLTGAIGSGCTSGAEFLSQEKVDSDKLINRSHLQIKHHKVANFQ